MMGKKNKEIGKIENLKDAKDAEIIDIKTLIETKSKNSMLSEKPSNKKYHSFELIDISYTFSFRNLEKIANELIHHSKMQTTMPAKYEQKKFYDKILHLITVKEPFSTQAIELFRDYIYSFNNITYLIQDLFECPESELFRIAAKEKNIKCLDIFQDPYDGKINEAVGLDIEDCARCIIDAEIDRFHDVGRGITIFDEQEHVSEQLLKLGLSFTQMAQVQKDLLLNRQLVPELYELLKDHIKEVMKTMIDNATDISHGKLIDILADIDTKEIFAYVKEDMSCMFDERYIPRIKSKDGKKQEIPKNIRNENKRYHEIAFDYFVNKPDTDNIIMALPHADKLKNSLKYLYYCKNFCEAALNETNFKTIQEAVRIVPMIGSATLEKKVYMHAYDLGNKKELPSLAEKYRFMADSVQEKSRIIKF